MLAKEVKNKTLICLLFTATNDEIPNELFCEIGNVEQFLLFEGDLLGERFTWV